MTVLIPYIGVTDCTRAISLLEEYPQNIVGSFWVMCGYGFKDEAIPHWWIDNVLKDNQAQGIIDAFERGYFREEHDNPLYLGFCIIVVADSSNPAYLSYVIQHLRMDGSEGITLLKIMARYNIPAITEVTYPEYFLKDRYGENHPMYENLYKYKRLNFWSVHVWEDYCSYLMSQHGNDMFSDYCKKINPIKN